MSRLKLGALLAATVLMTASGCGSGDSSAQPESLTFWGAQETPQPVKDMIEAFGRERGIKTSLVTVPTPFETNTLTKWTTGERPDVIFWQPLTKFLLQLNPREQLQDLSGMPFASKTRYDLARQSGSVDGKVYTATFGFPAVFGVFYNKQALAKAGVSPPTTPDQLLAAMRKVKATGGIPLFLAGGDAWTNQVPVYCMLTSAVADGLIDRINRKQAGWTEAEVVDALSTLKSYVDQQLVNPDFKTAKYTEQSKALLSGRAAFVAQGSWMVSGLVEAASGKDPGESIGFIPWPGSEKVQWQTSNLGSIQLPKTGNSEREKLARDFVDYATGTGYDSYVRAAKEPSVIEGVETPAGVPPLTKQIAEAYGTGSAPSVDMQAAASFGDFPTLVGQLLAGTASPQEIAATMQREFERNAKLVKAPGF